jgi:hypothetical protein
MAAAKKKKKKVPCSQHGHENRGADRKNAKHHKPSKAQCRMCGKRKAKT